MNKTIQNRIDEIKAEIAQLKIIHPVPHNSTQIAGLKGEIRALEWVLTLDSDDKTL